MCDCINTVHIMTIIPYNLVTFLKMGKKQVEVCLIFEWRIVFCFLYKTNYEHLSGKNHIVLTMRITKSI